ncbi:hypothetical protein N7G274_004134 [Stereocaulon virgatum]|uniref:Uncharacterized protein n=1 Tax=Stereocaulon virgatum TaxID=373712 RepID=A0ABR4AC68_9LECA
MAPDEKTPTGFSSENQSRSSHGSGALFYAYARRTDSHWASRYLLTFASAAIANEWWSLVEQEYPNTGVRTHPQLFSFQGDALPRKTANNKKFEHLTTKWFYCQIGDSDRTDGRMQDIIPAQDGEGNILVGGGGGGGGIDRAGMEAMERMMRKIQELMEGNASQIKTLAETQAKNNERSERVDKMIEENSAQIKTLQTQNKEQTERINEMVEENAAQIKVLVETQAQNNERSSRVEKMIEGNAAQIKALAEIEPQNDKNFERVEKLVEENANQIRAVSEGESANWDHMKVLMQEQRDQLKALADGQSASAKSLRDALEQSNKASSEVTKELKRQRQQNKSQVSFESIPPIEDRANCPHDVHPPPRKIDKKIVGYDYGQRKSATGVKEKPAANGK